MADPTTMQRRVPVGYRFCPTEEELVAYYLHPKLMAPDPSIYHTIPEIDVCKYEPWELPAFPEMEQDDSECYFFSRCDYKYSNSTRFNRTTPLGFWKVTGKARPIKHRDTNKVIGIKKNLVYYEGRVPHGIRSNWVIHEYHDDLFPPEQRTYVVCKLMKKDEKKTKEKPNDFEHESIGHEMGSHNHTDFEYENPANFSILSKEHYLSNMNSTVQTPFHPEVMDSVIHTYQPNEAINSKTWTSLQPDEECQPNEDIDSMIQSFYAPNEVLQPELNSIMDPPLGFGYEEFY
ncbi:hypothetical protein QN277_022184 [Acacia crassicarpa]|uniref:NAC domain-containing protein n=1 Tax=Acacia crassicarpa TaxID=499986 RepID=A0AAE1JEK9_9FABA|nr:hypothetical protein QN277_022184 [Acacia crassicarpa]